MKNYRIVTDAYAGYEAQVRYSVLPFVWFQLNAEKSVNTWNTCEQAMDFIKVKRAGTYARKRIHNEGLVFQCDLEVKRMLSFGKFLRRKAVIWQDSFRQNTAAMQTGMLQHAY
jgi:hypothetical protein